jgi:hypothetical protein
MKLDFPHQIVEKFSNIKFNENLWEASRSMRTDRQSDTHDEANGSFPQFFLRT